MPRSRRSAVAGLAVALVLSACGNQSGTVIRFEDSRVELHAAVERSSDGGLTVVADFRPTEPHLHLYGQELPDGGIDGAGRPTRLVVSDPAWRGIGVPSASVASELVSLPGFDAPFATYPDGPVTLRQAIEATGDPAADGTLTVTVTFMACSSAGVCFKPVEDQVVDVPLP